MDLEFEASETPSTHLVLYDEDFLQEGIKCCRFIMDPLYNDRFLLDREIVANLLSAVLHCSK